MNKLIFICVITIVLLSGCNKNRVNDTSSKSTKNNKEINQEIATTDIKFLQKAIKRNEKAVNLISQASMQSYSKQKAELLDSAIKLLKKAIELDSTYHNAYSNWAHALILQEKYKDAIEILDLAVKMNKNNDEAIMMQGFLFEKMGMQKEANLKYTETTGIYKTKLKNASGSGDSISAMLDIAYMLMITDNKAKALHVVDSVITHNPENNMALLMKNYIEKFNREEFIESL